MRRARGAAGQRQHGVCRVPELHGGAGRGHGRLAPPGGRGAGADAAACHPHRHARRAGRHGMGGGGLPGALPAGGLVDVGGIPAVQPVPGLPLPGRGPRRLDAVCAAAARPVRWGARGLRDGRNGDGAHGLRAGRVLLACPGGGRGAGAGVPGPACRPVGGMDGHGADLVGRPAGGRGGGADSVRGAGPAGPRGGGRAAIAGRHVGDGGGGVRAAGGAVRRAVRAVPQRGRAATGVRGAGRRGPGGGRLQPARCRRQPGAGSVLVVHGHPGHRAGQAAAGPGRARK